MFFTYIMASGRNGTIYTGMTDDLAGRVQAHKEKRFSGFTAKYDVNLLVWFETDPTREAAFKRERQIKEWRRAWKLRLIEGMNREWRDLTDEIDRLLMEAEERWLAEGLLGPGLRRDERK